MNGEHDTKSFKVYNHNMDNNKLLVLLLYLISMKWNNFNDGIQAQKERNC